MRMGAVKRQAKCQPAKEEGDDSGDDRYVPS
jgi:hypothetical protein